MGLTRITHSNPPLEGVLSPLYGVLIYSLNFKNQINKLNLWGAQQKTKTLCLTAKRKFKQRKKRRERRQTERWGRGRRTRGSLNLINTNTHLLWAAVIPIALMAPQTRSLSSPDTSLSIIKIKHPNTSSDPLTPPEFGVGRPLTQQSFRLSGKFTDDERCPLMTRPSLQRRDAKTYG